GTEGGNTVASTIDSLPHSSLAAVDEVGTYNISSVSDLDAPLPAHWR
ncbi:hypothetical protein SFRURICE_021204, partial [Spodoptera frugiperda]